ncbi:unnamed protein product [Rhodiola kirilowii]
MKLANGKSTYIDFYANFSNKTVKVWSQVQEGSFALTKGRAIEKVTVLGLDGTAATGFELSVDGHLAFDLPSVELTTTNHNFPLLDDEDVMKKSMMVGIKGLNIHIGKNFAVSWKMGSL